MAKMKCPCGSTLSFGSYPRENEGKILKQQDEEHVLYAMVYDAYNFHKAVTENREVDWVKENLSMGHPETMVLDHDAVIENIVDEYWSEGNDREKYRTLSVVECLECGRIFIEKESSSYRYNSYFPDSGHPDNVLKKGS